MSEIKACPEDALERDLYKLADVLIAGKRVCTSDGFAHKPLVPASLLSAPERAIDAIIDLSASLNRASEACASVQRDRDEAVELIRYFANEAEGLVPAMERARAFLSRYEGEVK